MHISGIIYKIIIFNMSANISHFVPDESIKTCMVFLSGIYPPKNTFYVEKDLTLPMRLYPNARFLIRCNIEKGYMSNYRFFTKLYAGREIHFVGEDKLYNDKIDVIWFIHFNFIFFGGVIDNYTFHKWLVTQNFKNKVHILFNEEMTKSYEPLWDYVQRRNENFKNINADKISRLKDKTDWSNVTLLCNEDKFSQWVNERPVHKCLDGGINISYLTDKVLYDLPSKESILPLHNSSSKKRGIYIGKFIPKRISVLNKILEEEHRLWIDFIGPDSDKLKYRSGTGDSIGNSEAKGLMKSSEYGWSIYIGKGTPSLYLGATFYEPILNGIPVFVWNGTDPEHKLFPERKELYFNDASDLQKKVSSSNLTKLWNYQINKLL